MNPKWRSRRVVPEDLAKFDLILAMDAVVLKALQQLWPGTPAEIVNTMTRFVLEYRDGGAWIPYDQQDFDLYFFLDTINPNNSREWSTSSLWMSGTRTDPRTSRWGMINGDEAAWITPIGANPYVRRTEWPAAGRAFATHLAHVEEVRVPHPR